MSEIPYDQRLAGFLVRPLINTSIHPNHLTATSLIFGIIAATFFATGDQAWWSFAALFFILAVFMDHTDGELARMSGKTSQFGHKFDFIVGGFNYTLLFITAGIGLYKAGYDSWVLFLGFMAGFSNLIILTIRMKIDQQHGSEAVRHPCFIGFNVEDFIYLIGPLTWFAGLIYFFVAFGLGTLGYLAWTLYEFRKWNR